MPTYIIVPRGIPVNQAFQWMVNDIATARSIALELSNKLNCGVVIAEVIGEYQIKHVWFPNEEPV